MMEERANQAAPESPAAKDPELLARKLEIAESNAKYWHEQATEQPARSSSWAPESKVAAAGVTVPFTGLVLWAAQQAGLELPQQVAGELAGLLIVAVAYLVPRRRSDP